MSTRPRTGRARNATIGAVVALAALQWAWHAWLLPPPAPWGPWLAGAASLPLVLVLVGLLLRRRAAPFWAGVLALLYFCHGVTEAWTLEAARLPALAEAALAVLVILAANWDAMRARFGRRAKPPANV